MKLAIIGGGGVRAPLLAESLTRWAKRMGIRSVSLFDIDKRKAGLTYRLSTEVVERTGRPFRLAAGFDLEETLEGVDAMIATIRPGFEAGRARDERIALDRGVLGQETVGPAGFSFACRTIPELIRYGEATLDHNQNAWILNFTNPAGLVTEALIRYGLTRTIGICDSADGAVKRAATFLGCDHREFDAYAFGLNHLSWTGPINHQGGDIVPQLLEDKRFYSALLPWMPREQADELRLIPNEYLYYYYFPEQSLRAVLAEEECRGEKLVRMNTALLSDLRALADAGTATAELWAAYQAYFHERETSYMSYARQESEERIDTGLDGYAGVALEFLEGIRAGGKARVVLNVPNRGALDFLGDDEIIEVSCDVSNGAWTTLKPPRIPDGCKELILKVKAYERQAAEAILERRGEAAVEALRLNPMVPDEETAAKLFRDFQAAWPEVFRHWSR